MQDSKIIIKTVKQYNKYPISYEDMSILTEIAEKYKKVKNYVYERYGGAGSVSEITPGYNIGKEMNESNLRRQTGLPSIYFERAKYDALSDIRTHGVLLRIKYADLH